MKTVDEILKIKATVLYVLKKFLDGIDYIKLFKILYFAQQHHLVIYGKPIFNDTFQALKHGPVPSFSYRCFKNLEKGELINDDVKSFTNSLDINKESKLIFGLEEPDLDELSKANIRSLDYIIEKYKNFSSNELSELSHDEAWAKALKRAKKNSEDNRIFIIDIAIAGGADKDMVKYIKEIQNIKKVLSF